MGNETYTIIVVPHAKARFRKFRVSARVAKWAAGLLGAAAAGVLAIVVSFSSIAAELYALREVRSQNAALAERNEEYRRDAARLRGHLASLERTVHKLGVMAGVETTMPEAYLGGVGGGTSVESLAPSLDVVPGMERTVSELTERSARLEEIYRGQEVLLASTPSIWPVRGYLSSHFGNRIDPFTGQKDFHPAIDISTPLGAKVRAPADGVVVKTGRMGAYGEALIVNHGYGIMTRYGHLSGYAVKPGQRVKRGEVIGYVGSTGRANGPHLHYEVWVRDQAVNPIHYILDEFRSFG